MAQQGFSLKKFLQGFARFRDGYFREHENFLASLTTAPRGARALMIACSDSRVDPTLKFGTAPGEIFMIRNVASLVPPYTADGMHHGTSAAIEFAVKVLQVRDIVVLGHAGCGGIRHLLDHDESQEFLSPWMEIARDARKRTRRAKVVGVGARRMCEQEAIKVSLRNLMTFPWVANAVLEGTLNIHGWYVDLSAGTLATLDDTDNFVSAVPAPYSARPES
jgi:carbonic anhydrase